eukprot:2591952-Amphidinium_carterae.1
MALYIVQQAQLLANACLLLLQASEATRRKIWQAGLASSCHLDGVCAADDAPDSGLGSPGPVTAT